MTRRLHIGEWYKYCVEIRCQDTTSEDWEPYHVCNGELQSAEISDSTIIACS
jgi:hypothetical protein